MQSVVVLGVRLDAADDIVGRTKLSEFESVEGSRLSMRRTSSVPEGNASMDFRSQWSPAFEREPGRPALRMSSEAIAMSRDPRIKLTLGMASKH